MTIYESDSDLYYLNSTIESLEKRDVRGKTKFKIRHKKTKELEDFYLTLNQLIDGDVPEFLNSKEYKLEIYKW